MTALVTLLLIPGPLAEVPFEHTPGRIWLKATLNGEPVDALLDSGASGLFAFEEAAARARGTKGEAFPVAGVGEAKATGWHTKDLRFGLPGTPVDAPVPFILAPARTMPGRPIGVAAGFDFLLRYAVEIDYAQSRLRLFRPFTYHPPEDYRELRLRFVDRRPVVDGEIALPDGTVRAASLMIDTGATTGAEITRRMAVREGLDAAHAAVPVEDAPGGVGGPARRRRIGKARLRLAGLEVPTQATVSMTEGGASGAASTFDVLVGDDALRNLDVVFDYWHGRMYVKPRSTPERVPLGARHERKGDPWGRGFERSSTTLQAEAPLSGRKL